MSIVSVKKHWRNRRANVDHRRIRTYSIVYLVRTDSNLDGPSVVTAAVPWQLYQPYNIDGDVDAGARVRSIRPEQDGEEPRKWFVIVEFSSDTQDLIDANPLLRPPEIGWGVSRIRRAIYRSYTTGLALKNSAGQPFADPAPEIDESRLTLTVVRNEATFDKERALEFTDSVNETDWLFIAEPKFTVGRARCDELSGSFQFENGIPFYRVSYKFEFRWEGFDLLILDAGFFQKIGTNLVPIFTNTGQLVTQPYPLNGAGLQLPLGGTPVFLTFDVYRKKDFNELGLP